MDLPEKIIIIVGGSSGMGLAAARRFQAEGYDVVISSRSQARIDAALTEIGGEGYLLDNSESDTIPAFFGHAGAHRHLVLAAARELAPRRVNVLSSGLVDTPAYDGMQEVQRDAMFRDAAERLPVGRVGKPADIAEALLFLVRDSFVTGTVLDVDGGVRLG